MYLKNSKFKKLLCVWSEAFYFILFLCISLFFCACETHYLLTIWNHSLETIRVTIPEYFLRCSEVGSFWLRKKGLVS